MEPHNSQWMILSCCGLAEPPLHPFLHMSIRSETLLLSCYEQSGIIINIKSLLSCFYCTIMSAQLHFLPLLSVFSFQFTALEKKESWPLQSEMEPVGKIKRRLWLCFQMDQSGATCLPLLRVQLNLYMDLLMQTTHTLLHSIPSSSYIFHM